MSCAGCYLVEGLGRSRGVCGWALCVRAAQAVPEQCIPEVGLVALCEALACAPPSLTTLSLAVRDVASTSATPSTAPRTCHRRGARRDGARVHTQGNPMSVAVAGALAESLPYCASLTSLDLSRCTLGDAHVALLAEGLRASRHRRACSTSHAPAPALPSTQNVGVWERVSAPPLGFAVGGDCRRTAVVS